MLMAAAAGWQIKPNHAAVNPVAMKLLLEFVARATSHLTEVAQHSLSASLSKRRPSVFLSFHCELRQVVFGLRLNSASKKAAPTGAWVTAVDRGKAKGVIIQISETGA
jgi:hypothetical protein